jgi:hypothetical protein
MFATTANAMEMEMETTTSGGFLRVSMVWWLYVRTYQDSVRHGISRRMEKGMRLPEMIGVRR